jgi:hypothetical protein
VSAPPGEPSLLRLLRTGEALLGAVVQARDAQRERLDRCRRGCLMLVDRPAGEPQLLTEQVVVVVEDGQHLVASPTQTLQSVRSFSAGDRPHSNLPPTYTTAMDAAGRGGHLRVSKWCYQYSRPPHLFATVAPHSCYRCCAIRGDSPHRGVGVVALASRYSRLPRGNPMSTLIPTLSLSQAAG